MKKMLLVALVSLVASTSALADRGFHGGHGGGHGGGWGWRGAWVVPAIIGGAIIYDVTRPRTIFVEPAPVYLPAPVYVQQAPVVSSLQQPWYFCPGSGYYPQVTYCPTGWQVVHAIPPGPVANQPAGQPAKVPPSEPMPGSAAIPPPPPK